MTVSNNYIPSSFSPNQKYKFTSNEGLIGIDSVIYFSTNNYAFRGDSLVHPKPKDEYRIFLVGGSTTECLYIDDSKSVERQLEQKLAKHAGKATKVKVYNAGKSGDLSIDHLAMISHRINHLEPDLIILFLGLNDFNQARNNYNYIQLPQKKFSREILKSFLASYSQIMRRFIVVKNNLLLEGNQILIRQETHYKDLINKTKTLPIIDTLPPINTTYFSNNLKSIVGLCKTNETELILVTQATTWNSKISDIIKDYHWMTITLDGKRVNESVLDKGLESFNNVIRKVGEKENLHVFDLDRIIPKSEKYFYDDCHFNNDGINFYSRAVSQLIINNNFILSKDSIKSQ